MNQSAPVNKLAAKLSWLVVIILVILPFHAFITVWLSSLVGHYTLLRLWKEFLLVPIVIGALFILFKDASVRKNLLSNWLVRLMAGYSVLLIICGFIALSQHSVSNKAMWYGLLVDLRFLVFFLSVLILAAKSNLLAGSWQKVLLIPAIIVGAFAILQFLILPNNFLSHFGYGPNTISPYETINHNIQHIRVESTLRGANPLGAYLIVPICVLAVSFFKDKRQRLNAALFGFGLFLALLFSFSRSAWIGAVLGVLTAAWLSFKSQRVRKNIGWSLVGILIIGAAATLVLRNNLNFENAVFHTDRTSKAAVSSNQGHSAAFKSAAKDIIHHPLGSGVGSAGPQSVYNNKPARIAENYYLQIGQEAGILGMVLFISICVVTGKLLFERRTDPLALALLASLIGLSFVNLLSHAWADDTLAYIWWGLAGIALTPAIITDSRKHNNGQKIKKS